MYNSERTVYVRMLHTDSMLNTQLMFKVVLQCTLKEQLKESITLINSIYNLLMCDAKCSNRCKMQQQIAT